MKVIWAKGVDFFKELFLILLIFFSVVLLSHVEDLPRLPHLLYVPLVAHAISPESVNLILQIPNDSSFSFSF